MRPPYPDDPSVPLYLNYPNVPPCPDGSQRAHVLKCPLSPFYLNYPDCLLVTLCPHPSLLPCTYLNSPSVSPPHIWIVSGANLYRYCPSLPLPLCQKARVPGLPGRAPPVSGRSQCKYPPYLDGPTVPPLPAVPGC
jgi:hypothetical protein